MQINLPVRSFAFFKVALGFLFLVGVSFFPIIGIISIIILIAGRAHTLGAWLAMWSSKKLNWKYISWVSFFALILSFLGFNVFSMFFLSFLAYLLFSFHFLYDEFDLQEEKRSFLNILSVLNPTILLLILLCSNFYNLNVSFFYYVVISLTLLLLEFFLLKEINWFFVHTKILVTYILFSIFMNSNIINVLNVFLVYHYLFWFIYPVYKLHKYKREERDGLIMILIIVSLLFVFIYSSQIWGNAEVTDVSLRVFYIATILHILSTAPFGYYIGLPRPKVYS